MDSAVVPPLKITLRDGGYARGREGFEQILHAALKILIEQGYRAISFRRIADVCGMKVGNVTYYFPSKEDLVRTLLDAVISSYEDAFDAVVTMPHAPAEQRLERLVSLILDDITSLKTTRIFPELWALSNHDQFVYDRMHELYARARQPLEQIIREINPALPAAERATLALFMSASMEGMTVFAGADKPFIARMPWIVRLSGKSFVWLAQTLRPGEIDALIGEDMRAA